MELKNLFNLIEIEKQKTKELLSIENEELKFFDNATTTNRFNNIQNLLEIDRPKLMTAYLCTLSNKLNHEEVYNLVNDCIELAYAENEWLRDKIFELLKIESEANNSSMAKLAIKIAKKDLEKKEQYKTFEAFKKLIETYGYSEDFAKIFAIVRCVKEIKEEYLKNKQEIENIKNTELIGIRMSNKDKKNINEAMLKDDFEIKMVIEALSVIEEHYDKLRIEDKNTKRILRKKLANYTKLSNLLQGLTE